VREAPGNADVDMADEADFPQYQEMAEDEQM